MVGRGRLLVVNITVGDSGSATWAHHCIRTSAMTRVFRRTIFFHELGRPFFLLLRFFPFFLFFAFFFCLERDCSLCAICDTWLRACAGTMVHAKTRCRLGRSAVYG